jgi:GNAT superfamily N-acetyltransferase
LPLPSSDYGCRISRLGGEDCGEVAAIHVAALSGDVLPALGASFLWKYYEEITADPSQIIIGMWEADRLVGFCQISFAPIEILRMINKRPKMLWPVLRLAVIHPLMFLLAVVAAYRTRWPSATRLPEIAFIAILPEFQRRGYGVALIEAANRVVADRNIGTLFTKTSSPYAKKIYEERFEARSDSYDKLLMKSYWYLSWPSCRSGEGSRSKGVTN